ncbi:Probable phospholipid ABC transporter permease protein mlaE [Serratia plymuthica]|uniref:Probable phospholipid ABC transporter permease protein mlaE n=1 Tax=Serratia plymuthica TaxID=82996 RepID=A0A2X4VC91_SERPL|nr:Probable phospholipid ABC transporter permease protein mlaE [Serratia plymuthica]
MKATEQISSLEMMAVESAATDCRATLLAGLISMPLLTIIFVAVASGVVR